MGKVRGRLEILTQEEVLQVHEASLRILEKTGFRAPHPEVLARCERMGAQVNRETGVVRVPRAVMEVLLAAVKAEEAASSAQALAERRLAGGISTQVFMVDYMTRERRYGTTDDVMKGIALVQGLQNIPGCNAVTIPSDVHPDLTDVVSHQLIYKYSKKPGGTYILTPNSAKWIMEMGRTIGRSTWYGLETVSPLQFRKESLDMAMVFADSEMGYWIGPMTMAGATCPITLAGTLTMENSEILASIFLVKALNGGRVSYGSPSHVMDMRTMLCSFGAPEQALLGLAAGQMGGFYGLQVSSNSGLTDALFPDFQGGAEKALNATFSLLGGTTGIGCQGIVGADMGFSMEQLVLDNEWIDSYNRIMDGFEVNAETIAEDLIQELGIGANFIAEEHTVEHLRESLWQTRLMNRNGWENALPQGGIPLLDRVHARVEELTAGYRTMEPVVDAATCERLDYLAKCAREELLHG